MRLVPVPLRVHLLIVHSMLIMRIQVSIVMVHSMPIMVLSMHAMLIMPPCLVVLPSVLIMRIHMMIIMVHSMLIMPPCLMVLPSMQVVVMVVYVMVLLSMLPVLPMVHHLLVVGVIIVVSPQVRRMVLLMMPCISMVVDIVMVRTVRRVLLSGLHSLHNAASLGPSRVRRVAAVDVVLPMTIPLVVLVSEDFVRGCPTPIATFYGGVVVFRGAWGATRAAASGIVAGPTDDAHHS